MKRVIVDYKKLTTEILSLLVEKFPDGYGDDDIIHFKNSKNEAIEAIEVRSEDAIYLVKVSTRLAYSMENFDEDDDDDFTTSPDENINTEQIDIEDTDDDTD
ncbi:hypothetical protein [Ascidiimonas aurantiaca]|uniref:hypothetical protein n=1 Tax=Ascidiimonas aurantiaca TaxID=1685432 RepID=UPI0030ED3B67